VSSSHQEGASPRFDTRSAHSDRRHFGGRRKRDCNPRADFTKKWIVVLVAAINGLSLVGEALISGLLHAGC